jgi:hypothetical protein
MPCGRGAGADREVCRRWHSRPAATSTASLGATGRRGADSAPLRKQLTAREVAALRYLPTPLPSDIAAELYVSLNTVKTHCQAVYRKLGVTDRRQCKPPEICGSSSRPWTEPRGLLAPAPVHSPEDPCRPRAVSADQAVRLLRPEQQGRSGRGLADLWRDMGATSALASERRRPRSAPTCDRESLSASGRRRRRGGGEHALRAATFGGRQRLSTTEDAAFLVAADHGAQLLRSGAGWRGWRSTVRRGTAPAWTGFRGCPARPSVGVSWAEAVVPAGSAPRRQTGLPKIMSTRVVEKGC